MTTARATKTSLAIKMICALFFNFSAFISVNSLKMANIDELPYGVLGTALKFGLREETEFVPVFRSSKHRCKRNSTVVFVQVVKKSALDVQNLLFFIYLLGSLPSPSPSPSSRRCSQDLSVCVKGYESEHILVKTPAIFSLVRYICYSRFGPLMNCFVSPEAEIWVERQKKKVRLPVRKKNYCKQTEVNELRQTVLLK